MMNRACLNYSFSNLEEGDLILLREGAFCYKGRQFKVIGPPSGNFVPILLQKGEGYLVDTDGSKWGIDTEKYQGKTFVRVFFEDIIGTTKQIPKEIENAILRKKK